MYDLIYVLTNYKKYGKKLGNYSKNVLDLLGLKKITETDKAELYFKLFKLDLNNNTSIY